MTKTELALLGGNTRRIFVSMLRELMKSNNVSYWRLAEALGHDSIKTIRDEWLDREVPPNAVDLYRTAKFFGVSMDYLLTGEEPQTKCMNEPEHDED